MFRNYLISDISMDYLTVLYPFPILNFMVLSNFYYATSLIKVIEFGLMLYAFGLKWKIWRVSASYSTGISSPIAAS